MTSRTSEWRRRRRVKKFLFQTLSNNANCENLINDTYVKKQFHFICFQSLCSIIFSSYQSPQNSVIFNEDESENMSNDIDFADKQSQSSSIVDHEQIYFPDIDEPCTIKDIESDLNVEESNDMEDMEFFNL